MILAFFLSFIQCKKKDSVNLQAANKNIILPEDKSSLIRNPAMGWALYDDAYDHPANAETYWAAQDSAARKYANIFYIRWRWADFEPEEGKYAWIHNENYKKLIKGALDRNMKLAFRVFMDSRDMGYLSTPQYVKDAGAKGYLDPSAPYLWSPYPEDPIFREKFEKFIAAFAAEYNKPDIVDYIDGHGLGKWGEGWSVITKTNSSGYPLNTDPSFNEIFEWTLSTYAKYFDKILLCFNFNDMDWDMQKRIAVNKYGFVLRRDGLGGDSYPDERGYAPSLFPKTCFFGEAHYWMVNQKWNPGFNPWLSDKVHGESGDKLFQSWYDVYKATIDDALAAHANSLDMREEGETIGLLSTAPDQVKRFMLQGGYRFYPYTLSVPDKLKSGSVFQITHSWVNRGVGVCPNNNIRWGYKFKPALALFDLNTKELRKIWIDEKAEPSEWILGKEYKYVMDASAKDIPKGKYLLGLAIVDKTKDNQPGINLAVISDNRINKWIIVSEVVVE